MATQILLNGVDWSLKIADADVSVKENKVTEPNIRGGSRTVAPRAAVPGISVKLLMPYITAAEHDTLFGYFTSITPITLSSNTDLPDGTYVITDYGHSVVKSLDSVFYTIALTLTYDVAPQVPAPVDDGSLPLARVITQLGF